jgi:hypothetical protein
MKLINAKLMNVMMPSEFVVFDFNPQKMTTTRQAASPKAASGTKTAPNIFKGTTSKVLSVSNALLVGDDVVLRADQLCKWMEPGGGLLGQLAGKALSAISGGHINIGSKLPALMFLWGPFIMNCTLNRVSVSYERFSSAGAPNRASISFDLQELVSVLGMLPTNPTSGGLPGRQAHVVTQGTRALGGRWPSATGSMTRSGSRWARRCTCPTRPS